MKNLIYLSVCILFLFANCNKRIDTESNDGMSMSSQIDKIQLNGMFYYAFDKKNTLSKKEGALIVKTNKNGEIKLKSNQLGKFANYKDLSKNIFEINVSSEDEANALRMELNSDRDVISYGSVYLGDNQINLGTTDEILLDFLPNVGIQQQHSLFEKFNVKLAKTRKTYKMVTVSKGSNTLDIANRMYETGYFRFCYPNFLTKPVSFQVIPNDTYFPYQITLNNTGQVIPNENHSGSFDADIDAPEAWQITTGSSNVTIAVIDEGVTSNHPDLPNSRQVRLNGSNFGAGDPNDPSPVGNANHGNSCAGVIGATMNNNEGIAGIAPNCRIMPIRLGISDASVVDAINFAVDNGAQIISNSYGWNTTDQNYLPAVVTAIQRAINLNRVVVFAAGNNMLDNSTNVFFPANVNVANVLTVGASDRYDRRSVYSGTSSLIDIVAPSHRAYPYQMSNETLEMWSIDIPGSAGYNSWPEPGWTIPLIGEILPNSGTNNLSYTGRFGGTSHSCPVIAGVAALMLSVNPNLTNQQVFDIITQTADKVGGYNYVSGRCAEMGFGRVNAYQAVLRASAPSTPVLTITSGVLPMSIGRPGSSGIISAFPGSNVRVNISASGQPGYTWTLSTSIIGATPTGNTWVTNGSTFYTFVMPASGNVNWSAYFSAPNSAGSGNISVQ